MRLQTRRGGFCGGTLVASKFVITAAHCLVDRNRKPKLRAKDLFVNIGDHDLNHPRTGKLVRVKKIHNHPKYRPYRGFDISILELAEELDLDKHTPACLAKSRDGTKFDGKRATVAGWGVMANGRWSWPRVPHEVDIPVISSRRCRESKYVPSIICAGSRGKDACAVRFWHSNPRPDRIDTVQHTDYRSDCTLLHT